MTTLFLYGTLLDAGLLARLVGRAVLPAPAWLAGWRRVYLRRARYPTLARGARADRGCGRPRRTGGAGAAGKV